MRALLPHPLLTAILALVWVLLLNDFSWGAIVFGLLLGFAIALLISPYWPERPHIRNPLAILEYFAIVLWDIVVSNVQVAYLVLFRRGDSLKSQFVTVPIALESPEAIATLAGTITMTPGTLSADLSADGRSLLVHCLDTSDPDGVVATIKSRYERRLMRIFV
ncbi:Na+/H+ antiporter subunit E [Pseudorhodoplanes sinuspersici]|uniref:Na+/H+ antiporter subunit E n=1 Tax=Pseudorhodoplanes sinuspersici TaxID=1235591 RepID=A0A1W6ZN50_9HYPH|nr:Na+/H+ antiporter subunit E [Pseudorhodoplanes sinuspersici]ARP98752.1 Na+/H+ antiporter subunit E [Pseudorhodoplanes sinuspersici]RKE69637.1 multisubunit potassium/proton antiporter PhaE subunit [Pseudorhodoplanes sinuspersici]